MSDFEKFQEELLSKENLLTKNMNMFLMFEKSLK